MKSEHGFSSRGTFQRWTRFALAGVVVAVMAGCGGSEGPQGPAGVNGTNGTNGTNGANGTNGKDLTAVYNVPSNATAATTDSSATWAAFAPQVTITSVTVNGAPVVKFTVKDAAGKAVVGLGNKSQSATATVAGLTNIAFTFAKLVPGTKIGRAHV